nr:transposase family protein [Vibrio parahaemolyticus]
MEPYARITNRLRSYIEQLLPLLPIKHIAQVTGVHSGKIHQYAHV